MVSPLISALVVILALPALADPPAKPPFSNKYHGEGGGYKHPDASVGDFFEHAPGRKPDALNPERPERPGAPARSGGNTAPERETPRPVDARPERPRPRPFPAASKTGAPSRPAAPRPGEEGRVAPVAEAAEMTAPAATLWNGKLRPLPAGTESAAMDAASEDARRDYETRLLGEAPDSSRPALDGAAPGAAPGAPLTAYEDAPAVEGALFVSLELDPREAGSLRDAVAGLGAAASFRPDARFQPTPAEGGAVRVSGWLPVSRLGDAIARPGVRRVSVERGARPAAPSTVLGSFVVGIRVTDAARPEESVAAGVRDLTASAGFRLSRVYGVETGPDGAAVAVVAGTLPLSRLGDAMARPGVVKIAASTPAPLEEAAPAGPAPSKSRGFLDFVRSRGLWLALLTLLLALPTLGEAIKNGLSVFVPYR